MRQYRLLIALTGIVACQIAAAQQIPPQWNSSTAYIAGGLVRGPDGNYYRATHNSTNRNPTTDNHAFWELYYCRASVNLTIATTKATFTSLKQAWTFVSSAEIATAATINLHINTTNGIYAETFATPFNLNSGSGSQIQITGDDPTRITINVSSGTDGFVLTAGHSFGGINGLTMDGGNTTGNMVHLSDNSTLGASTDTMQHFTSAGFLAERGSTIVCSNSSFNHFSGNAVQANTQSRVTAHSMTVTGNNTGGYAVLAELGSTVDAVSTTVSAMNQGGFFADQMSSIDATSTTASGVTRGYTAAGRSYINASSATCNSNNFGFTAQDGGFINARSVSASGNITTYTPSTLNSSAADGSVIIQ